MKAPWLILLLLSPIATRPQAAPANDPVVVTDFSNPDLVPSHWTLTLHHDGSGHFHSDRGDSTQTGSTAIDAPNVDRDFNVTPAFADRVFLAAQHHNWFNTECESHYKVAFQGWKKLTYQGPDGQGTCTFNYSKDRDIQSLGDSLTGVAETLLEGARLETLLQHDRLGLDREMEFIAEAAKDGRIREICAIREILSKLEADPEVLERVRKKARNLLAHSGA